MREIGLTDPDSIFRDRSTIDDLEDDPTFGVVDEIPHGCDSRYSLPSMPLQNEVEAHLDDLRFTDRSTEDGDGLDTPLKGNSSSSEVLVYLQCLSRIVVCSNDLPISVIICRGHTLSRPLPPQETIALVVASD